MLFLIALSKALTGPFPSPSHIIVSPSTSNSAFADETISPDEFFLTDTSYALIIKYLGISPTILLANNSNDASAPS